MSGVNRRHKKTDHKVGFFRIWCPRETRTFRYRLCDSEISSGVVESLLTILLTFNLAYLSFNKLP